MQALPIVEGILGLLSLTDLKSYSPSHPIRVSEILKGIWMAISVPQIRQASGGSGFRILMLPWIVLAITTALTVLLHLRLWREFSNLLNLWLVIGLANNLFSITRSRRKLSNGFRTRPIERFSGPNHLVAEDV